MNSYSWLPLLIIPYGILAIFSGYFHGSAPASLKADEVHAKRVKAFLSVFSILVISVVLGVYLLLAGRIGFESWLVRVFPLFAFLTGAIALASFFVTPWELLIERAGERLQRAQDDLRDARSAFSILSSLPPSYKVWVNEDNRAEVERRLILYEYAPPEEYVPQKAELWNKLEGMLPSVIEQIRVDVGNEIETCRTLGGLVKERGLEQHRTIAEGLMQRVADIERQLDEALEPRSGESYMAKISHLRSGQRILETIQEELRELYPNSFREHGEQKLKILECLTPDSEESDALRKELDGLIRGSSAPVEAGVVKRLGRETEDFFRRLTSRLEITKTLTERQFRRDIQSLKELAERIRQRVLAPDREVADGYVRQFQEIEASLRQMLASSPEEQDIIIANRYEEWKRTLESGQEGLRALYLKSVLKPNADVLSRLNSLAKTPEDWKEGERLKKELDDVYQRGSVPASPADIMSVDERVRRIFEDAKTLYAPLQTENADVFLKSTRELEEVLQDLEALAEQVGAGNWWPGISQRLADLARKAEDCRQQLNSKEPLLPQILHDASRTLADGHDEVRNLTMRIDEAVSAVTDRVRDRFLPYLEALGKLSAEKEWDERRQQALDDYLLDQYGLISKGIERKLLNHILGNEELVNLITGG